MPSEKGKVARRNASGRPKKTTVWDGSVRDIVGDPYTESKCEFGNGRPTEKGVEGGRMHPRNEGAPVDPIPVENGAAPWLWSHKISQCSSVHVPEKTLLVYPQGFETNRNGSAKGAKKGGGIRGEIDEFTSPSRKRLRRKLMRKQGPEGWERWAWTLTIRQVIEAEEWRRIWHLFVMRLRRAGIPVIWRVELQRRGVPHIHLVAWLPNKRAQRIFREGWLECTGEDGDGAAVKWAVKGGPCDDREFSAYVAAHTGKGKEAQLGWKGRQWGVVCEGLLREVTPEVYRFTVPGQEVWFDRFLERFLRSTWKGKNKRRLQVSRTNGQCRFLGPDTVRRLLRCSYVVAKGRPKEPGRPITREDLERMKIVEKSC